MEIACVFYLLGNCIKMTQNGIFMLGAKNKAKIFNKRYQKIRINFYKQSRHD